MARPRVRVSLRVVTWLAWVAAIVGVTPLGLVVIGPRLHGLVMVAAAVGTLASVVTAVMRPAVEIYAAGKAAGRVEALAEQPREHATVARMADYRYR